MGGEIEQSPVPIPFQEVIEAPHEAFAGVGIGLGDVLQVAAHEDQATGAALAFSGGDAGTDTALCTRVREDIAEIVQKLAAYVRARLERSRGRSGPDRGWSR